MDSQPTQGWMPALRTRLASRATLLVLAILTSPLCCYGSGMFLGTFAPIPHSSIKILNITGETLYVTPVDETPGRPVVIEQHLAFRQRDIPLRPNSSIMMKEYGELQTLSGIAVCREQPDCRWATEYEVSLPLDSNDPSALVVKAYTLNSFEELQG